MGQACGNVNRNLKWAFVEIANLVVVNQRRLAGTRVMRLYQRVKRAKNHQKAVVAVGGTWPRQRGRCSAIWRFIASRTTGGNKLFRRREGKRGCPPTIKVD
jgi:hypothetical protein